MDSDRQAEVISLLEAPATHGGDAVERVDTHASIVFLAGPTAWKLKRAVRYDYLDFSTVDRRRVMCERELAINRRTAPDLYLGVVPVTREPGGAVALAGTGPAVDWLLKMRRFDGLALFDRLASADRLPRPLMPALTAAVVRLHASAEPRPGFGGSAGIARVIDGNEAAFAASRAVFDQSAAERLTASARAALDRHAPVLDRRRESGFVRQCHGDLHLRNIVLIEGVPTLFDAIEFNDDLACIDVMYDVAFLLMDLWRRGLRGHANVVLNEYVQQTGDIAALRLLPLFLSCRAAIRAKTSAAAAALAASAGSRADLEQAAREYLALAAAFLDNRGARILAIGGPSGAGKSTVAAALAPDIGNAPGALIVRSDLIRKRLCGVEPLTRLGSEGYTPDISARVYTAACDAARGAAAAGHAAIVDAVFSRRHDRQAIAGAAAAAGVPFTGLWLEAPAATLVQRVAGRRGDPSDADAGVIASQLRMPGPPDWLHVDATKPAAAVAAAASAALRSADGGPGKSPAPAAN